MTMLFDYFSKREREYRQVKRQICEVALQQAAECHHEVKSRVQEILAEGLHSVARPKRDASGKYQIYTPRQVSCIIEMLLEYPPELAVYMVTTTMPYAIVDSKLPVTIQGDIMMGFEKIRAVFPQRESEGAAVLAAALCMLPSASRAHDTLTNIGVAYTELPLSEPDVRKLTAEGFVVDPPNERTIDGQTLYRLHDDLTIRKMVREYLIKRYPQAAKLIIGG